MSEEGAIAVRSDELQSAHLRSAGWNIACASSSACLAARRWRTKPCVTPWPSHRQRPPLGRSRCRRAVPGDPDRTSSWCRQIHFGLALQRRHQLVWLLVRSRLRRVAANDQGRCRSAANIQLLLDRRPAQRRTRKTPITLCSGGLEFLLEWRCRPHGFRH